MAVSREACEKALISTAGKVSAAAAKLGISRHQFYRLTSGRTRETLGPTEVPDRMDPVEKVRLTKQLERERKLLRDLAEKEYQNAEFQSFVSSVVATHREVPEWVYTPNSNPRAAVACSVLSDIHYSETILPEEIDYCNAYNVRIADLRIRKYFENLVSLQTKHCTGFDYSGTVLSFLGDFISGSIHDELAQTNEISDYEAVLRLSSSLTSGLRMLAGEVGRVHVKCVTGNHPRNSRKPRFKERNTHNLDWLIYHVTARDFVGDPRVTFEVSEAADLQFRVLNTTYLATHGDQFKGGSGIAAALSPLLLGDHRKRKRASSIGNPYDWMVMGHFHNLMLGVYGILMNGALCGYNEYAYGNNFPYEPASQAFWVNDAKYGVTVRAPILVQDEDEEGWGSV